MQFVAIMLVTLCVGYLSAERPVVQMAPDKVAAIMPKIMECIAEHPIDPDLLLKLREGKDIPENHNSNLPKFFYCALVKTGYTKKNGRANVEKFMELEPKTIDQDVIRKVIVDCDKDGKDPVDTAVKFLMCFRNNNPVTLLMN